MVGIFGKFKKQSLVRKENIRNSGAQTHKEIMDKRKEGKETLYTDYWKIKHMRNRPSVFLGKYEKQDYAYMPNLTVFLINHTECTVACRSGC